MATPQLNLLGEVGLHDFPDDSAIVQLLLRGRCRDSSLARYVGPARAWLRYCHDRGESPHDASTAALLRWLDARCRESRSHASMIKMSLAAARFVQRGRCVVLGVEAIPYTPRARIQLDAWVGAQTLQKRATKRARGLTLAELAEVVRLVRADVMPRPSVTSAQAHRLALRDAAMLLVGWWGGLRADDLARLRWEHVTFAPQGVRLDIPQSKTTEAILALVKRDDNPALCPMRALRDLAEITPTVTALMPSVFMLERGAHVGRRIKALFARHGMPRGYSGHSLRVGFATEAAAQNVPDRLVQQHCRWTTTAQHAEYVRSGRLWQDTPTARIECPKPSATIETPSEPSKDPGSASIAGEASPSNVPKS